MFIIEGYSHQEIGQTLGITESTSKTQLAKAKAKLKILINPKQYGYGNA
jgi:RNA polymerase sigma-70 factor (ECF subfamily)